MTIKWAKPDVNRVINLTPYLSKHVHHTMFHTLLLVQSLYTNSRSFEVDTVQFTCPTLEFSQTKVSEGTASSGANSFTSRMLTVTATLVDSRGLSVKINMKLCMTMHSVTHSLMSL